MSTTFLIPTTPSRRSIRSLEVMRMVGLGKCREAPFEKALLLTMRRSGLMRRLFLKKLSNSSENLMRKRLTGEKRSWYMLRASVERSTTRMSLRIRRGMPATYLNAFRKTTILMEGDGSPAAKILSQPPGVFIPFHPRPERFA